MKNVCNKCFNMYCILLFIIIIILYVHFTTDQIGANVIIATKNSSESKKLPETSGTKPWPNIK